MLMNGIKNKSFRKTLHIKIGVSIVLILIGIVTLLFFAGSIKGVFSNEILGHNESFAIGFYTGLSSGLIGAGIITIIKSMLLLKNEDKFKQAEIEYHDERNAYIITKTFAMTTYISLFALLIGVIVFGMINLAIFETLLYVLGAYALILLIVYTFTKKAV